MSDTGMEDPAAASSGIAEGARLARQTVALGKDDAVARARGGHALAHFVDDLDSGIALIDEAQVLDPNLASAWFLGGFLRAWRGESDDAIEQLAHAMRLSPLDPEIYRMQAVAHLFAGRFDSALSWAEKARREMPDMAMVIGTIAASHALVGRKDEARRAMRHLRQLDPALRISHLADWLQLRQTEELTLFADGLRRAGLPK